MADKRALLDSLAIDRSEEGARPGRWAIGVMVVLAFLIGMGAAALYLTLATPDDRAPDVAAAGSEDAASDPVAAPAPSSPALGGAAVEDAAAGDAAVLNASGYITARRMATVSAEITGRLTALLVEEGMAVEEGQILARLDDALAQVDLGLARAQVVSAEAQIAGIRASLDEAGRVLRRVSELNIQDFSSAAETSRARAEVERLTAELGRAEAQAEIARLQVRRSQERVDDHIVRAPFSGIVVDKNAQPGEIVAPGSAGGGFTRTGICTLVDMKSLEIEVDVNEAFIGRVRPGQPVEARLDAYPDWAIPAHVVAIIPTANRDKATVQVRIGIDVEDRRILPEMGVNVAFLKN